MQKKISGLKGLRFETKIFSIYLFLTTIMVIMLVSNVVLKDKKEIGFGLDVYYDVSEQWLARDGGIINFSKSKQYKNEDGTIDIYYTIPLTIDYEDSIVFRSKNTCIEVYVGDKLLYERYE